MHTEVLAFHVKVSKALKIHLSLLRRGCAIIADISMPPLGCHIDIELLWI